MASTISVSELTRRRLAEIKSREGVRSMDELLRKMAIEHRKLKLLEASEEFRRRLKASGLTVRDLLA